MDATILAALGASAVIGGVVLLLSRAAPGAIPLRQLAHPGRLRLPVRAFERAAVIAVVAAVAATAPSFGANAAVVTGAIVVAVAVAWCARRGVFVSLRRDGDNDGDTRGAP
jgi:hypothetical protein